MFEVYRTVIFKHGVVRSMEGKHGMKSNTFTSSDEVLTYPLILRYIFSAEDETRLMSSTCAVVSPPSIIPGTISRCILRCLGVNEGQDWMGQPSANV